MADSESVLNPMGQRRRLMPLHLVAREKIFRDIAQRGIGAGERYCTESELAKRLHMSRNTIRRAVAGLQQEGYLSRRRRIGVIVGKPPGISMPAISLPNISYSTSPATMRQRVIVVMPGWDDSVEGRFSGQLLRALASPELSPRLAVEIRHPDDHLTLDNVRDAAVLAIDPRGRHVTELQDLAAQGVRVVLDGAGSIFEGLIMIGNDRRSSTREAVKKLYAMGHRHVGLLNYDTQHLGFSMPYFGFLDAHRELDKPIHPRAIVQQVLQGEISGQIDLTQVTGWICTYLRSTEMIGEECRRMGLDVPRDISVISLDDPGDRIVTGLGMPVTAYGTDFELDAAKIHSLLHDWQEELRGKIMWLGSKWIDRGTIGPPGGQIPNSRYSSITAYNKDHCS